MIELLIAAIILAAIFSIVTNPFARLSIVQKPFIASWLSKSLVLTDHSARIVIRNQPWWRALAWFKAGFHILETRYVRSPRAKGKTVPAIIKDIHRLRYDTSKLLLISGDHFSPLFVRNLGVFYYPMLDRSIASSAKDWQDRQIVYLETTAFALGAFNKTDQLTTTIVTTGRRAVTCTNFYAYPSDTLYGILYALAALGDVETPAYTESAQRPLSTQMAAAQLLNSFDSSLKRHYETYRATVYDETTGLIKTDLHLSGAKDITRRYSAFYDNVIFWKTTELAMKLELIPQDKAFLRSLKQRILKTFWLPQAGHFLEDLSEEGIAKQYYSSDWLVVLFTGFLDPTNSKEQKYFMQSIAYIDVHDIDQPFAIKYQQDRRAHRQFLAVRLAVASYGGDAIWSFWGMEYIKTLILLYKSTGNKAYLKKADYHIAKYQQAMLRDGGFPEVYDKHGKLLQTPFYRSIRQTGWVIGFEQALALRATVY